MVTIKLETMPISEVPIGGVCIRRREDTYYLVVKLNGVVSLNETSWYIDTFTLGAWRNSNRAVGYCYWLVKDAEVAYTGVILEKRRLSARSGMRMSVML